MALLSIGDVSVVNLPIKRLILLIPAPFGEGEVVSSILTGSAMDRSPRRASILRLFHQLSDRCRQRDHR
jgi:hypothetical protein